MNKQTEKYFNDLETRLVQRFNGLLKKMEQREALENKRLEKLIDAKVELAHSKLSAKVDLLLRKLDQRKL